MAENKALVIVKPEQDIEVRSFYLQALKLRAWAGARVIATPDDLKPATDELSVIAKVKKGLEGKKRDYLKPFQDHVKETNEAYKSLMEPIETADKITRDKILAFRQEQERICREQEEINRLRIEAAQKEKELKGEITEPVELVEVVHIAPKQVTTEMGTTGQRMIKKWELVDKSLVPEEYKILDSATITRVVKAGIPSIPGIHIYAELIVTVNAK